MKKCFMGVIALVALCALLFAGEAFAEEGRLHVVTTIFPIYDWVQEIVGGANVASGDGDVEITMLLDSRVDLHSYPRDYPPLDTEITVTGIFSTYYEGDNMYVHLADAQLEWSA